MSLSISQPSVKKQFRVIAVIRYFALSILISLVLGPFLAFLFCPNCFWNPEQNNIHVLRYYTYTAFICLEAARFVNRYLNKKYDWQTETKKRFFSNIKILLLIFVPLNIIYVYFVFQIISDTPHLFDTVHMYVLGLNNFIQYLLFSFWLNSISFLKSWKKSIERNKKLEAQRLNYQLQALKNQINPHFLFNNLNTLSQIIKENPETAEQFIDQLSKVYRYLLQQKDKNLVPIEDELKFLDSFLFLIKIRFQDQTIIEFDQTGLTDFYIAPIVLQLVIENAIKHNEASKKFPLHIQLYREAGYVVIKNNVKPKLSVAYSSGIGLRNIQERYELLTDKPIDIEEDFNHFTVRIPIIHQHQKALL